MNLEILQKLWDNFKVGDEIALTACETELGKEENEYFPLWCLARSARALNPLIIEMEMGNVPYNNEIDDAYRTMVRNIMDSLQNRIVAHINYGINFAFFEKEREFRCRRCNQRVGWLHPDLQDRYMFSSAADGGSPAEGICYECWAKEHPTEDDDDNT